MIILFIFGESQMYQYSLKILLRQKTLTFYYKHETLCYNYCPSEEQSLAGESMTVQLVSSFTGLVSQTKKYIATCV